MMSSIPHETGRADRQTLETVFRTLANRRQRFVLHALRERDGPLTIDELAYRVAEREAKVGTDSGPTEDRERVYTSLYMTDVPALVDAGLIVRDDATDIVELTDLPASLEANLALAEEIEG